MRRLPPSEVVRRPDAEIVAANPWYVEDQFAVQIGSPAFRAVVENRWRVFTEAIDDWMRSSSAPPPARLLDAGCGDGINLSFFARLARERRWPTRLFGVDYNPLRLGRAQGFRSSLARSSLTSLGLAAARFDVIVCNQVLEHIPNDRFAFHELRRVLRPGGLLIIGVPNEGSPLGLLRNHLLQRSILATTDHVNMYTRHVVQQRLLDADLELVRIQADGFFVPHTRLHGWLYRSSIMRRALQALSRVAPSCAAGLVVTAIRPH